MWASTLRFGCTKNSQSDLLVLKSIFLNGSQIVDNSSQSDLLVLKFESFSLSAWLALGSQSDLLVLKFGGVLRFFPYDGLSI